MNLPTPVLFGKVVGTVGIPVIGGLVGTGAMKDEVWVIDQACSVKMAGYWPSSFFGFIIWDKTPKHDKLYLRDKARIPGGQDSSILPARVANHSARFGSSCPLAEVVL